MSKSKHTFGIADVLRDLLNIERNSDSDLFEPLRKRIDRDNKLMANYLNGPKQIVDRPMKEYNAYKKMIKSLYLNGEKGEELLSVQHKLMKGKVLNEHEQLLEAEILRLHKCIVLAGMNNEEKGLYDEYVEAFISGEFYTEANKKQTEAYEMVMKDLELFSDIENPERQMYVLNGYFEELQRVSESYRDKIHSEKMFSEAFMEIIEEYTELPAKVVYSMEDLNKLPKELQLKVVIRYEKKKNTSI
ncbi:hypothetical protein DH09_10110 [Bacillaceae bacterium JMAK1]|nr:hypothetical protein DH09_10110 [Bacillaceae bacterium JMAK1]